MGYLAPLTDPVAALALAAVVACALLAAFALARGRRAAEAVGAWRRAAQQLELARQMLASSPDGLYFWDRRQNLEFCSRRLSVLLGLNSGTQSRFADVVGAFRGGDSQRLIALAQALREQGTGFDVTLQSADGKRALQVVGMRAPGADGRVLADVIWFRDVTRSSVQQGAEEMSASRDRMLAALDALPWPVWIRDGNLDVEYSNRAAFGTQIRVKDKTMASRARAEGRIQQAALGKDGAILIEAPLLGRPGTVGLALSAKAAALVSAPAPKPAPAVAAKPPAKAAAPEPDRRDPGIVRVLETLAAGVAIFGSDGRLAFYNSAYAYIWPLEGDFLSGQPTYGDILERLRETRRLPEVSDFRAYKEEQLAQFESLDRPDERYLHLPDGTSLRCVASPHPMGGLIFVYEDVTDKLSLERSINSLSAVQRTTLDHLHEGVAVFGGDAQLKLMNAAMARMWGLEGENAVPMGTRLNEFVERWRGLLVGDTGTAQDDEAWTHHRDQLMASIHARRPESGRLERIDGTVLEFSHVPLPDGAVLLSYVDVTDSAKVERALLERAEAMHEADRLKSEFIANVSHEVRTPLTTVIGFAEVLAEQYFGSLNPRQLEYSNGILETSRGLMKLVSDIIDLATIEAGRMALELDAVDMHGLSVSVVHLVRERIREKKQQLEFDCPPDIGWAVIDGTRIRQVLYNLLANAVTFTPPGGRIRFSARRETDNIVFEVSDTGIGIPLADQDRVFAGFERSAESAAKGGGGLGLTLVARFVELHGGTVAIQSAPNEGTTVTIRLPSGGADL